MKIRGEALMRVLLTGAFQGEQLMQYLPSKLASELQEHFPIDLSNCRPLALQHAWIQSIHFSWFYESLKTLDPESQTLFLSLLPKKQAVKVRALLSLPHVQTTYSYFMYPFLIEELKKNLYQGVDVACEEHLPFSKCHALLRLTNEYLLDLIDLLGIYDLAADLRQIVDKKLLHKVHMALSDAQRHFLHYCTQQPMKWVSPKIGLSAWDGSKPVLRRILHKRGLIRLGRALVEEDESFRWHLLHRIDTGRAKVIESVFIQTQRDTTLTLYFKQQVLHLVKRYQNNEVI